MKITIGKWLLDVAKYMTTAMLLSYVFSDLKSGTIFFSMVATLAFIFLMGLYLSRETNNNNRRNVK